MICYNNKNSNADVRTRDEPPGALLAWGQIVAALLDALENYALIQILLGTEQGLWAQVARWSAQNQLKLCSALV